MIKIAPPSKGRFLPSIIISIYKLFMAASLFECNKVNKKRIYRLMQICGLEAVIRRRRKKYPKVKPDYVAKNALAREFTAEKPNQERCTDVV